MNGEVFAGTTIAAAGIESLSTIARKVSGQICKRNMATLSEESTIEIFENGQIRENLIIEMSGTLKFDIEFIDGQLAGFTTTNDEEIYSFKFPGEALNVWIVRTGYFEMMADAKFDRQNIEAQIWEEKKEEIDFLYHIMYDTDNYDFPPAAWGRLAELES
jgi:hypothetical protein